tara:strand:- start:237 stop:566 length:330 start_codon:yes stop_codon:yes gene_type:complete
MSHFKYITDHLLRAWVQSWIYNFKIWADLMTNNYEAYANPYAESPERECYEWFWASISMDETYSKDFLESLYQMMDDIDTGNVKTVPAQDVLKTIKELVEEDEQKYYDE